MTKIRDNGLIGGLLLKNTVVCEFWSEEKEDLGGLCRSAESLSDSFVFH